MREKEAAAFIVAGTMFGLLGPAMCKAPLSPAESAVATATAIAGQIETSVRRRVDEELARRIPPSIEVIIRDTRTSPAPPALRPPIAVPPGSLPPPDDAIVTEDRRVLDARDPNLEWEKAYFQQDVREGTVQRRGCFRVDRYYDQSPRSVGHVHRNTLTGIDRC